VRELQIESMKKNIVAFIPLCAPLAELHVEVLNIAQEDRTKILEELEGYTIISEDAKAIKACKTDKFEVLKADLSELQKKGWVWSD
jgi:hypothetical protein